MLFVQLCNPQAVVIAEGFGMSDESLSVVPKALSSTAILTIQLKHERRKRRRIEEKHEDLKTQVAVMYVRKCRVCLGSQLKR